MKFSIKKTLLLMTAIVFLVTSLFVGAFRAYTLFTAVDPTSGFYTTHSSLSNVVYAVYAGLSVLVFLVPFVARIRLAKKGQLPAEQNVVRTSAAPGTRLAFFRESTLCTFVSAFLGFSLITFSVMSFIDLERSVLSVIICILGVFSGLYFLSLPSGLFGLYSTKKTLLSVLPIAWSLLMLVAYFWSSSRIAVGEHHRFQIACMVCVPLFFYAQTLFLLPDAAYHRYHLFYSAALACAGLTLVYALPTLLLSAFWIYSAYTSYTSLYELMMLLSVALYAVVHLFRSLSALRKIPSEEDLLDEIATVAFHAEGDDQNV